MPRLRSLCLVPLVVLLASGTAHAATFLVATLTNGQENPPVNPTTAAGAPRISFGTASFVLNDAQTALTFTATINGLDFGGLTPLDPSDDQSVDPNDNLVNAHIHAGPMVTPLTNGPVVWGFIGNPFHDTIGPPVVITRFMNGVGATVSGTWDLAENSNALAAQLPNILAGRSYINFHTIQFGGGELRGNITAVPEPATMALLGLGLAGLTRRLRTRK